MNHFNMIQTLSSKHYHLLTKPPPHSCQTQPRGTGILAQQPRWWTSGWHQAPWPGAHVQVVTKPSPELLPDVTAVPSLSVDATYTR